MRAFNRVLSAFLAAVLVVVGVLAILEICRAALGQPPAVVQWPKLLPELRHNRYKDAGPILVCVGLAVFGLLLLICGIRRGKPYALPAGSSAPGVRAEIHRRSLQRAIQIAVLATDRVEGASVTLGRKSARIVARASTHTIDGLDADIRRRVEALLTSIALAEPPRLKVKTYPASAPPAPKSAQTPVGVSAGPAGQAATVGDNSAGPQSQPTEAPVAAVPVTPKPEPAVPSPPVERQSTAHPDAKRATQREPRSEPKAADTDPGTTRLDDLLSDPKDDDPR